MLNFHRVEPAKTLNHFIQGYWQIQCGDRPELLDLVPDGYPEIVFSLQKQVIVKPGNLEACRMPGTGVVGQLTHRFLTLLPPYTSILFVKMYPWTPYLLFDDPIWHLNNKVTDLECLTRDKEFRQLARDVRSIDTLEKAAPLLDGFFLKKLASQKLETPFLTFAIQQIFKTSGTINIESLRQNIHASRRYVEKLFKKNIGLTPKQYARLIRVKKASIILRQQGYRRQISSVAAALDYYDQSHFLKDFKMVVGKTPSQYLQMKPMFQKGGLEAYLGQWDYS